MSSVRLLLVVGAVLASAASPSALGAQEGIGVRQVQQAVTLPQVKPGELIVGFAPSTSAGARAAAITDAGVALERHLRLPGYSLVRVPAGREQEYSTRLLAMHGVESVEPNLIRRASFDPNDEFYSFQWHFTKIGMPAAWDKSTGTGVTVAVVDTGVAYETCAAATCGTDYFQAPDFVSTTFVSPRDEVSGDAHPNDENGHGTHVASTVAESTNNTTGAAGVAFNASIMPVQVLDENGSGSVADGIDGITWAVNNGANVINLSLGGPGAIAAEEAAIDNAVANGVVVVVAAGNGGGDGIGDPTLDCPACYPSSISVGATRFDDTRSPYSNYGDGVDGHTLDLVAPAGDVTVDQNGDTFGDGVLQQTFLHACSLVEPIDFSAFVYCFFTGTSMATPHVAGAAALLLQANPSLNPEEVGACLKDTALDLGAPGVDSEYGHGRIQVSAALNLCAGVGGIAELPDVADEAPLEAAESSAASPGVLAGVIAGAVLVGPMALSGAWYMRRRWMR